MKQKWFIILGYLLSEYGSGLQLKKLVVFSRHGLRAPLSLNLEELSPKKWPQWTHSGHLTPKGVALESYMGEYFSAWLHREGLFRTCHENSVYIYSNYLNRTRATARAFSEATFPGCNVTLHYKNVTFPFPQYDPIFPYLIKNTTTAYQEMGTREIQKHLNESDLRDVYTKLNDISDLRHSDICKNQNFCDLNEGVDGIEFHAGISPTVTNRFFIASLMVDVFLMSYYEGFPLEQVGWGGIGDEDWKVISKFIHNDINIRFNLTVMREHVRPLLQFLKDAMEDDTLFTLIVGHDSNLAPLMFSMGLKPYVLPEQWEPIPIGCKLVFQKWTDGEKDFMKVEFVYQSWKQIRDGDVLSFENPPKNVTLQFKRLTADENGMYPWEDFVKIFNDLLVPS